MMKVKGNTKSEKGWMSFLVAFSLLLFAFPAAEACTGMYAGKKVTVDGSVLIGRTADPLPFNGPFRVDRYEPGESEYADGTVNTWAFHCASKVTSQQKGFSIRRWG